MPGVITEILMYGLAPAVSAFGGWVFGQRKLRAEVATNELDNVSKALSIYQSMVERLGVQLEIQQKQIQHLEKKLYQSEKENRELRQRIETLEKIKPATA